MLVSTHPGSAMLPRLSQDSHSRSLPMAGFEITRTVNAPVERVFEVFTDLDGMWQRCKDIVKIERVTVGPVGTGTVFKETRTVFGRESTETMKFTEFQPPNRWVICGNSCGTLFTTSFDLQPEGSGTRVIVNTRVKPLNPLAWILALFTPLLMGTLKRAMNQDLDTLSGVADGTLTEQNEDDEATAPVGDDESGDQPNVT